MLLGQSKLIWILLLFLQNMYTASTGGSMNERLINELQIDDQELVECFDNITETKRRSYESKRFGDVAAAEAYYGEVIKLHRETLKDFLNDVPSDLERNLSYMLKPGDWLLPAAPLTKVLKYKSYIQELKSTVKLPCPNRTENCYLFEKNYTDTLRNSRNPETLEKVWSTWQSIYNEVSVADYARRLQYVKFAAKLNGRNDVKDYWQFLTDYEQDTHIYDKAEELWDEIKPFYMKFHKFVMTRLHKYYKLNDSLENIPIYLLGDKYGSDWSEIADIILPHPQLHYDLDNQLRHKDVEDFYHYSAVMLKTLQFGQVGKEFWVNSVFNATTCGPKIFEFPEKKYTSVEECNQPSWTTYLDAHEAALTVALNDLDYSSLPRQKLRFSAMDNAILVLGSILAVETVEEHGLLPDGMLRNAAEDDPVRMTKLLLVALRVLPSLPYYLAVDNFRLEEMEKYGLKINETINEADVSRVEEISVNTQKVGRNWWNQREKYEKITSVNRTEPDFLNDVRILENDPFINKFYGVIVAFQLIEYYNTNLDTGGNLVQNIGHDETFKKVVDERTLLDWVSSLTIRYGMDISASALLNYFQPLEKYFDTAPKDQVPVVTTTTTTTTEKIVQKKHVEVGFRKGEEKADLSKEPTKDRLVPPKVKNTAQNESVADEPSDDQTDYYDDDITSEHPQEEHEINKGYIEPDTRPMWLGIVLFAAVSVALVVVFVLTYVKKRRERRRNSARNRRFDT